MEKIAILTGSTGGLGQAFIVELLKEDITKIWCVGRNKDKLDKLVEEYGNRIRPIECDLTNEDSLTSISKLLEEHKPNVKYLINNAGMAKFSKFSSLEVNEISKTINVNCKIPSLLIQICLPYMERGSKILNISSASSFQPNPYIALYSATKVYLRSYSRSLNYELKGTGITVTAVCPGWIKTDMIKNESGGKKVHFPGLVSPSRVVKKALKDAKRNKDMSVCTLLVKYEHLLSKILPQKFIMKIWGGSVKKYIEE